MQKLTIRALVLTMGLVAGAQADLSGPYAGLGVGYADHSYNYKENDGGTAIKTSPDVGGAAWNLFAGYNKKIASYFVGAEVYYDMSSATEKQTLSGSDRKSKIKNKGAFGVAARGAFEIVPNAIAYLRLGVDRRTFTLNSTSALTSNFSKTSNLIGFVPGVGVDVKFHDKFFVRGEYTYAFYPEVKASNGQSGFNASTVKYKPYISTIKVAVAYQFNQ